MQWKDFFEYDDGKLIWKINIGKVVKIGEEAGSLTARGYIRVGLKGNKHLAHRIIWEMSNGPIPAGMEIDHIDGKRANNRIQNLRLVTCQANHLNMAKRKDNTSGHNGVVFSKQHGKWQARVKQNGKIKHLGFFESSDAAGEARKNYNLTSGFSDRHGS